VSTEASKTKSLWKPEILNLLKGDGIDIGCGKDPILPQVMPFDLEHGDANHISAYVNKEFDFVFSSHCLEHTHKPREVLHEWYKIVKRGGHLIILVPDEDLYEQGRFPSIFNSDHKNTFTISKNNSWSSRSHNLLDMANELGGEIVSLELQDHGYDRSLITFNPGPWSRWLGKMFRKVTRRVPDHNHRITLARLFRLFGASIDQTDLGDLRLAQIQLIVKKK
jgi:SAM-dependent methyltransferase